MIITVTMNPAIDRTVTIDKLCRGGLNRVKASACDAGGKGINVSTVIKALGGESLAMGFLGGNNGKIIERALEEREIRHDFIWVEGETRTNTKVVEDGGGVTEINEPGPAVGGEQMEQLLGKIQGYAGEGTLFVLSGSALPGTDQRIYERLISLLHKEGACVLLDADGALLANGLREKPDIVKPNRTELERYGGLNRGASEKELLTVAGKIRENGTKTVALSLGAEGALFLSDDGAVKCRALPVTARSAVGAGDAMVAALALAWEKKLIFEETVRLCMAASAGAAAAPGTRPPAKKLVDELRRQVILERISWKNG